MTQFKIGDRVRYTGKQEMLSPQLLGKTATVTAVASDGYVDGLEWDDQAEKHKSCFAGNLELIEDDRLTRLEAFVARVASDEPGGRDRYRNEAKALVAELNPVDRDTLTARNLAALVTEIAREEAGLVNMWSRDYSSGDADEGHVIAAIVEALRQARKEGPTP